MIGELVTGFVLGIIVGFIMGLHKVIFWSIWIFCAAITGVRYVIRPAEIAEDAMTFSPFILLGMVAGMLAGDLLAKNFREDFSKLIKRFGK